MDLVTLGVLAASVAGAGLQLACDRALRRRWRAWIAHESGRYGLRAEVPGDGPVCLGASLEDAGGPGVPSSSPTLESVAAVLDDGADRAVHLPAGIPLRVRAFDGARRVALESVTGSGGTRTRYSFEVPKGVFFWILDAEGEHAEGPSGERELRLAPRPEGYELTTSPPPIPADLARHAPRLRWTYGALAGAALLTALPATETALWVPAALLGAAWLRVGARSLGLTAVPALPAGAPRELEEDPALQAKWILTERPLWLQRLFGPERWLLPGRRPGCRALVYDLSDPFGPEAHAPRDDLVAGAAALLADAVWLHTDLPATVAAPAVVGRRRVQRTGRPTTWEEVSSSALDEDGRNVAVYGEARADLDLEGYAVRLRATREPGVEESAVAGPLPGLGTALVDALLQRGLCGPTTPPPAFALPPPEALELYLRVHDLLILSIMMSASNGVLPAAGPGFYDRAVDLALELCARAPSLAQAPLCGVVAAIYGAQAGQLSADRRDRILALVRAAPGPDDALFRLAPAIFARLGEPEEARARLRALAGGAVSAYRGEPTVYGAWLREVEESLPPPSGT